MKSTGEVDIVKEQFAELARSIEHLRTGGKMLSSLAASLVGLAFRDIGYIAAGGIIVPQMGEGAGTAIEFNVNDSDHSAENISLQIRDIWQKSGRLLAAYEASGLTQSAFARREGINFHTFVAWLGQRRKATAAPPPVSFREVCLSPAGRNEPLLEVALPGGLTVRGSSAVAMAELVRALRA